MKVLVGVNTLESVNSFVYSSHCAFWTRTKKDFPNDEFVFFTPYRMSIDHMRNEAARLVMTGGFDYLMFIDDDVIVQPQTFKSLYDAQKDIVMALTFVRGYPFPPMFFGEVDSTYEDMNGKRRRNIGYHENWEDQIDADGLVKTAAVGFSCVLIKADLFKVIPLPFFVTGPGHTEDVYFCLKATACLEPEPSIYVDTKVPTSHICMNDAVSRDNVKRLRELYKPPDEIKPDGVYPMRMKAHVEKIIQQLA